MPKFYCDYCEVNLTSNSMNVRKTHIYGRKHKERVRLYYQKWLEEQGQQVIDVTTVAFNKGRIAIPSNNMIMPSPGVPHDYGIRPLPLYPWVGHPPVIPVFGPMMMGLYGPTLPMMVMQPEPSMENSTVSMVPASPVETMRPVMTDPGLKPAVNQ